MRDSSDNLRLFNRSRILETVGRMTPASIRNRALITEPVTPGKRGRLHYEATDWFAISADGSVIEAGTVVDLLGRDGLTYIVRPTSLAVPQLAA